MLRGNPQRRCSIKELLQLRLFEVFERDLKRELTKEEVDLLKENYRLNVQTNKRVEPKVFEEAPNQDDFFKSAFEPRKEIHLLNIDQFVDGKNTRSSEKKDSHKKLNQIFKKFHTIQELAEPSVRTLAKGEHNEET